jgi:hypothetical protein
MGTPPTGTPIVRAVARATPERGATATIVPRRPGLSPDEFLMTEGWQRIFDAAVGRDDVVEYTVRQGGAVVRMSETTLEIPRILATPERVAHLCKHCWELSSGDQLTGQLWRCDGCRQIAAY